MRVFSALLALLLAAPAVGAQAVPDTTEAPRLVTTADRAAALETPRAVAASTLGVLVGAPAGYGAAMLVTRPSIFELDSPELMAASATGLALGAAAGASLYRGRSFWRAFGGAALGQIVGFGVGALVDGATGSDLGYIAVPAGAVAGSVWATR